MSPSQKTITSHDQALQIKRDKDGALFNRGNSLKSLGRYEEAIASYQKSLEFLPDDAGVYYDIARCYALMVKVEWTVKMLQRAIELDGQCSENAKTDTDFDSIRDDPAFQALLQEGGDLK